MTDRSDIPTSHRWDITALFSAEEDWKSEKEAVRNSIDELRADIDSAPLDESEELGAVLDRYATVLTRVEAVEMYIRLQRFVRQDDESLARRHARMRQLLRTANELGDCLECRLRGLSDETVRKAITESETVAEYRQYLSDLRQTSVSPAVEAAVSEFDSVVSAPEDIHDIYTSTALDTVEIELDGERIDLLRGNYISLLRNEPRDVRRAAYRALSDKLYENRTVLDVLFKHHLNALDAQARSRGYDSALDESDIPPPVYDRTLKALERRIESHERHLAVKRRALGVDDLSPWDLFVLPADSAELSVSFDQAREYILESVSVLGDEYRDRLAHGFESRWIDVMPHNGKRARPCCLRPYVGNPYVLLNFTGDIDSLYTMVHELGHAMHMDMAARCQPYVYASVPTLLGEVASTMHEILLSEYLCDELDGQARAYVRSRYAELLRTRLFRHGMAARFEQRAHERVAETGPVRGNDLHELYRRLQRSFFPTVRFDGESDASWTKIEHLYTPFQMFTYTAGTVVALTLVDRAHSGESGWLAELFGNGTRLTGHELLTDVGIDLRDSSAVETAIERYVSIVESVEDEVNY
ncbi:MAG: M3 family oligoendopeptidase [Halorhabdus sp.]